MFITFLSLVFDVRCRLQSRNPKLEGLFQTELS